MCEVIAKVTPYVRLELAQGGEPTLNPNLYECLRIAREITPTTQIQVTTNGLTLLTGQVTFHDLFEAGAHSVYIDMYAPLEKFRALAEASGAEWYYYNDTKIGNTQRRANTYYNDPAMRLIILQDSPVDRIRWRKLGRLSTFLNHIDWPVAIPYGLLPVREPYARRCTLPMRYASLTWEGDYLFCCIDFWGESAGLMGNVKDGPEAFTKFWFGQLMQAIRRQLVRGNRAGIPYCSRCNCAFSKCDWTRMWPSHSYDSWWNGSERVPMPPDDDAVFADGWRKAAAVSLPTIEQESEWLRTSTKQIIKNTAPKVSAKAALVNG